MCIDNMQNRTCGSCNNHMAHQCCHNNDYVTMPTNVCGCGNYNMPINECGCNNMNNYDNEHMETMCSYVPNYYDMSDDCSCGFDEGNSYFPDNPMLGQSYVPIQTMNNTFKPCVGLKMGTLFPELVSPYMPCQSIEEINYIKCRNEIKEGCNKC